jgi:hypothetical protein
MIVFLPTYKRSAYLKTIIEFIVSTRFQIPNERKLLVINNNNYNDKVLVDSILNELCSNTDWQIKSFHHSEERTCDIWYPIILKEALENELIFLLGDDDILLPDGIVNRFNLMNEENADFLLSQSFSRVFLLENGEKYYFPTPFKLDAKLSYEVKDWVPTPSSIGNVAAVFNHAFRKNKLVEEAIILAISFCERQNFINPIYSYGLLPCYIPHAIKLLNGKVLESSEIAVLRGAIVEETISSDYSDGGTSSFYSLILANTFSKIDFSSFIKNQEKFVDHFLTSWRMTFWDNLISKSIKLSEMKNLLSDMSYDWTILFRRTLISLNILHIFPFFRAFRLKQAIKNKSNLVSKSQLKNLINEIYQ